MSPPSGIRFSNAALFVMAACLCLLALTLLSRAADPRDFLYFHAGFISLISCPLLALVFLRGPQPPVAPSMRHVSQGLMLLAGLSLLLQASDSRLPIEVLQIIHRRFQHPSWHWLGLGLAAAVYLPLAWRALRTTWQRRARHDLVVCGGFLLIVVLVYLPHGFNSSAHWESWNYRAHLEGLFSWNARYELTTRFWVALPHALGMLLSPDSFAGFHIAHLLMHWAKMTLLYGLLRKLGFAPLHAFLISALFMLYPVNSGLLSLRSLPNQFSALSLLAAAYFMRLYTEAPTRLGLLGVWLALAFNVASTETGYALIAVVPLLWLLPAGETRARKLNWTAIWLMIPLCQLAQMLLMSALDSGFYNHHILEGGGIGAGGVAGVLPRLLGVFQHTFIDGWVAAFRSLGSTAWLSQSLAMVVAISIVAWHLRRRTCAGEAEPSRNLPLALLFTLPAVGVLIWLPAYAYDTTWRLYFYVPMGAAVAVVSLAQLLLSRITAVARRDSALIIVCLALMLPAASRLFLQRDALVQRAHGKAAVLNQIVSLAPQLNGEAHFLLTTRMTKAEFAATDIGELRISVGLDDSFFYLLYGDGGPASSTFCFASDYCLGRLEDTIFAAESAADLLQRTLVFMIDADLSVTLLRDPATHFNLPIDAPYDPAPLIAADMPPPSRAKTMLGISR